MLRFNFSVIGISVFYETRDDTPTVTFNCNLKKKEKQLYFVMSHSFEACLSSSVVQHTFTFGLLSGP